MFFVRTFVCALSFAATLAVAAPAATNPRLTAKPQARILRRIDNTEAILRPNTTTTAISQAADQGRVDGKTYFKHMMLVLRNTDEQESALAGLLDQQQDKSSPNYHQWMTPETFGTTFGVAGSDIAQVTAWLQEAGLTVEQVARGARIIQFSGTAKQVEAAFHTEMHAYVLNGERHVANSADISIPSALASVVVGVASLNNFDPRPHLVNPRQVVLGRDGQMYPALAGTSTPDYTSATSGTHYVGANDLATLFNTRPLLNAGIDGTGVSIGIIGRTDILLSDVQIYRSLFKLPPNDPTFTLIGSDPGTISDDGESDLDVELSGGIAPGASVNFVTSGDSYFGGGIDAAGAYLVDNNSADIISLSYGQCESSLGASGTAFYRALWEQAASQGQTVFVSSGDSGPSTCNSSSAAYSTTGYGVNGLASTPYNVAVGGSMFSEGSTATGATTYWAAAAGAPYSTALSYIPEIPWNEGAFDIYPGGYGGIVSAGSGVSLYYGTPAFQAGPGVPSTDPTPNSGTVRGFVVPGPHRYVPDVVLEAAGGHDGTIFCSEGSCKLNADGTVAAVGVVGGTSVAAPSMAGVQALINQKNGGRQGNANYYYYRVAATQSQANCVAATYLTLSDATCGFHDITTGNLNIPSNAAGTALVGWNAGPGYDLAVGLGSPDAAKLATRWSTVTFNATTTSLSLTPTTGIAHGASQNIAITVTPVSGTGTPTGDVSIIATAAYGGVRFYTLAGGSVTSTLSGLPAGTYTVYAHYAGDATYGGSNSAPMTVTISPESSVLTAHSYLLATNGALTSSTSFLYGANVYLDAQVAGASGTGIPTGTVTFALTKGTTSLAPYVSTLDSSADAYFDAGLGYSTYLIMPTSPVLPPGTYTAAISYSGDTSFNPSTATPVTFVVTPASQALALRAVSVEIASGATATFNASITTISPAAGGVPATGTISFTDSTTSTVLGTGTLGTNGSVVFKTNAITTSGPHNITATYSGDANYQGTASAAVTITVGGAASTIALAASSMSAPVGTSITLTATLPTGATGTVFFYDNGVALGGATISAATLTAALAVTTFSAGLHSLTAVSSGNSTQTASTSAAVVLTITKNTPAVQLTVQQSNASNSTVAMNAVVIPSPRGSAGNNPPPTGVVQFLDGTTVLGTATPTYLPGGYNNYVAAFTTQALKPGPHTLTAFYIGDANFASYTSNAQTVNIGLTASTLATSATSIGAGAIFTLTGRVVPQVATTAAVGGTITFYDGTTLLGTATVASGVATLATATLVGVGPHAITAVYSGDTNFYTSTAPAISVTVVQATTTPGLTVSATTVQVGTTVTLTSTASTYSTGTVTFLDNGAFLGTVPLTGSVPSASLMVTSFGARSHSLTATYNGDPNFLPGTSAAIPLTVTQNTPILQLGALQNTPTASALSFAVTLAPLPAGTKPNNPAPTGSVQYSDGTTILGSSPLIALSDGSGNYGAPFTTAVLRPGPHTIIAAYAGDANYTASISTSQSVTLGMTNTILTTSLSTAQVGTAVTLTATVSAPGTGTIMFFDDGVLLGSAAVTSASASFAATGFAARAHSLTATYSGDTNYYSSTSAATVLTVTRNTPLLQLGTLQSASAASPITLNATLTPTPAGARPVYLAPSGSVQYTEGATILGSSPLAPLADGSGNFAAPLTVTLKPGSHTIAAAYPGDANYAAVSTAAQTMSLGLTTVTLTSSATSVGIGTPILLTAQITPVIAGSTSVGGAVTFYDGTAALDTSTVTAGTATITVALTSTATHAITAVYSGDTNFFTSSSSGITILTVAPGVAVSVNPGSLTITRGSSGTATVSVTTTGNYSGTITPTCTGLPALSTCTFSPAPLVFSAINGTQTTTVTITTTAPMASSSFFWLPAFALAGFVGVRRQQLTSRSRHLLLTAVMVCSFMAVAGCGSSVSTNRTTTGGTPTGSSTVTVNLSAVGSTAASPAIQSSATLVLTIQ